MEEGVTNHNGGGRTIMIIIMALLMQEYTPVICRKIHLCHCFWKSQKKSRSTLRAKWATFTFWVYKTSLKMPKYGQFWQVFAKPESYGQIVLPDRSLIKEWKSMKMSNSKLLILDILGDFQTMWLTRWRLEKAADSRIWILLSFRFKTSRCFKWSNANVGTSSRSFLANSKCLKVLP